MCPATRRIFDTLDAVAGRLTADKTSYLRPPTSAPILISILGRSYFPPLLGAQAQGFPRPPSY
eukprot:scaffold156171_cov21-Tisochrysis_lutea.AAC.1